MSRTGWILVLDSDGLLVPARADALPGDARRFRTQQHAADLATKLNADLAAERTEQEFGQGERP